VYGQKRHGRRRNHSVSRCRGKSGMQEVPVVMQDILSRRNTGSPTAFADAALQSFREQGSPPALKSEPSLAQLFLSHTPCKAQCAQVHGVDCRQPCNTAVAVPHIAAAAYQASPWASLDTAARALAPDPTAGPQAVLAGKELACWLALLLPWS